MGFSGGKMIVPPCLAFFMTDHSLCNASAMSNVFTDHSGQAFKKYRKTQNPKDKTCTWTPYLVGELGGSWSRAKTLSVLKP